METNRKPATTRPITKPKLTSQNPTTSSVDGTASATRGPKGRGAGERILATATELFARFGYNGVSTRDVAAAAQVNEVTVYRHFPRKHDLYLAVLESELQQLRFRGDLLARIAEGEALEVILALSATVDGAATAHFLMDRLAPSGVRVTRVAQGVPIGGALDVLDDGTLATALRARR